VATIRTTNATQTPDVKKLVIRFLQTAGDVFALLLQSDNQEDGRIQAIVEYADADVAMDVLANHNNLVVEVSFVCPWSVPVSNNFIGRLHSSLCP